MVLPYVVGVATAPLIGKIVKPLLRGAVKTTIEAGLQVKKLAAEAGQELQGLAAEASIDIAAKNAESTETAADAVTKTTTETAAAAADKIGPPRGPGAARRGTT